MAKDRRLPRSLRKCPRCGRDLEKRAATRGANAGKRFWTCPDYPFAGSSKMHVTSPQGSLRPGKHLWVSPVHRRVTWTGSVAERCLRLKPTSYPQECGPHCERSTKTMVWFVRRVGRRGSLRGKLFLKEFFGSRRGPDARRQKAIEDVLPLRRSEGATGRRFETSPATLRKIARHRASTGTRN